MYAICFGLSLLLRICGFHENWRRDGRTFRMDVDEVICAYHKTVCYFESKERLGKICLLLYVTGYNICAV